MVPLMPKAIDTLHVLLERRGRVVEKAALMKLVWPDCTVEEAGLARNISLLRKALGDDAETWIETIPKRGYRFAAAAPKPAPAPAVRRRPLWPAVAALLLGAAGFVYWQFYLPSRYLPRGAGYASLAVIPFEPLGPEAEVAAFSRGFAESLVAEVAKLDAVQVFSPATISRYRRLGIPTPVMTRLLGVQVVVEGSVQKSGEVLRAGVRLTDVHSGKLIWADSYELPAADAGRNQNTVARAVAAQVGVRLSASSR